MLAHHRRARTAGRDDVLVRLKNLDEPRRQVAGLFRIAVVEKRLPAAGLRLRKVNLATEVLKDLCNGDADLRIKLVGQAGDEEGDVVRHAARECTPVYEGLKEV